MESSKICIVDDHVLFRKGMAEIVDSFTNVKLIYEASSGEDLLQKLAEQKEQPDIILMDIEMPHMDGETATKKVKELYPSIKVIILTMHTEEKYLLKLLENGADGYLTKNADPEEVEKAINIVKNEGYYFNKLSLMEISNRIRKPKKTIEATPFTEREREILKFIVKGEKSVSIADKLFISPRTVEGHRKNLLEKSGCKNSAELVAFALKNNLCN